MNRSALSLLLLALLIWQFAWSGEELSQLEAVAVAERFVVVNGYTNAPRKSIKPKLDLESLEYTDDRTQLLDQRHNTLQPKAIGAKIGRRGTKKGWSVAFDYASREPGEENICRVVTMDSDGTNVRIEHVDGKRDFFAGFN